MLTKDCFKANFGGACSIKGVNVPAKTLAMLYEFIKNDFTDAEFGEITKAVVLEENFYGKMPDIALWTKRKKEATAKTDDAVFLAARQQFQDKVMELVYNDYNPRPLIKEFEDSLTRSEAAALQALGGLSALWGACRKDGAFSSEKEDWVVRRIQDKFKENYNAHADDRLRIAEEKDAEMLLKIENLTAAAIKRIN